MNILNPIPPVLLTKELIDLEIPNYKSIIYSDEFANSEEIRESLQEMTGNNNSKKSKNLLRSFVNSCKSVYSRSGGESMSHIQFEVMFKGILT